jgi:hypothetical protein
LFIVGKVTNIFGSTYFSTEKKVVDNSDYDC